MRILILVLSYTEPPYDALMKAQQETWDSVHVPDIDTAYYYGGWNGETAFDMRGPENKEWCFPVSDEYYMMHWKFRQALCAVKLFGNWSLGGKKYDFIFRTNSSSYVNKEELLKFAETLPKEKCYAGWSLGEKEAVSGAGIWLSPDMVEILRNELPAGENIEEDILIGRILHGKHGIEIQDHKTRYDVGFAFDSWDIPDDAYHFRFKSTNRLKDVENMRRVHDILQSRKINK